MKSIDTCKCWYRYYMQILTDVGLLLPVGVDQVGVVGVELLGEQLVLLGALVAQVVPKVASEEYLAVVVDVASNLTWERKSQKRYLDTTCMANKLGCSQML